MVIVVKNFIDQDAEVLYLNIMNNLKRDVKITLDFKAIEKTTYDFLENTVGKIVEEKGFESIQNNIRFRNVDTGIKEMLSKLIKDMNKK
ncbi:STAS-like domain-containing protein [Psychrilyobacter sp.]|uniref:STAS-like domain-containing protein n=1 Tax=Psychrilyobacter sp. TaxID=2586924 RepID=UPI003017AC62